MIYASTHPNLSRAMYAQPQRALERFLSDAMLDSRRPTPHYKQDEAAFHLSLDVPGVSKDQLVISIEGAVIHIKTKEGAARQYRSSYELPQEVEPLSSEAKLENGVLTIKLAKKLPASKVIDIAVQ